jgi:type VI protein secretion system component VasK
MNETSAMITIVTISVAMSTATVVTIHAPLRRLLEAICPLGFTAAFWTRAAITVLYLLPLWVVLVFGVPDFSRVDLISGGDVARRALAAASFALVGIVIATGFRLANLRAPSTRDYPPPVR